VALAIPHWPHSTRHPLRAPLTFTYIVQFLSEAVCVRYAKERISRDHNACQCLQAATFPATLRHTHLNWSGSTDTARQRRDTAPPMPSKLIHQHSPRQCLRLATFPASLQHTRFSKWQHQNPARQRRDTTPPMPSKLISHRSACQCLRVATAPATLQHPHLNN